MVMGRKMGVKKENLNIRDLLENRRRFKDVAAVAAMLLTSTVFLPSRKSLLKLSYERCQKLNLILVEDYS